MAEKTKDDGELELDGAAKSSKKKVVLMIIGAILGLSAIIGGTVGLTLMLVDNGAEGQGSGAGGSSASRAVPKDALYIPVKTMTVNFAEKGTVQFLQLDLSIMTYLPELVDLVNVHMPVIRNDMLNLLGQQTFKDVSTSEGKEALRIKLLLIVQKVLMEQEERDGVEAIYFTKIIMQ